jgi:hypothetical protein
MNCKPGDLAMIVGARTYPQLNGMIIRITTVHALHPIAGDPCWYYEAPMLLDVRSFRDGVLRPIANPGDDERDCHDILVDKPVTA